MTEHSKVFSENLMGKLENLASVKRNSGDINHNLSARVNVNLSVEEVEYLAYLIKGDIDESI